MNKDDIFLLFHSSLSPRGYSEDKSLDLSEAHSDELPSLAHVGNDFQLFLS